MANFRVVSSRYLNCTLSSRSSCARNRRGSARARSTASLVEKRPSATRTSRLCSQRILRISPHALRRRRPSCGHFLRRRADGTAAGEAAPRSRSSSSPVLLAETSADARPSPGAACARPAGRSPSSIASRPSSTSLVAAATPAAVRRASCPGSRATARWKSPTVASTSLAGVGGRVAVHVQIAARASRSPAAASKVSRESAAARLRRILARTASCLRAGGQRRRPCGRSTPRSGARRPRPPRARPGLRRSRAGCACSALGTASTIMPPPMVRTGESVRRMKWSPGPATTGVLVRTWTRHSSPPSHAVALAADRPWRRLRTCRCGTSPRAPLLRAASRAAAAAACRRTTPAARSSRAR